MLKQQQQQQHNKQDYYSLCIIQCFMVVRYIGIR